jgi:IMP cyclohydrolase
MYVGRFVVVAPAVGAYRVSSRSFPNRQATERDGTITVGPTPDAEETEKLALGCPARDALADPLLALDFEKDDYDTPRIAGIVGVTDDPTVPDEPGALVGIVRRDALLVEAVEAPTLVATYEHDSPGPFDLDATDAAGAAREVYDHEFEHRVCAAGVATTPGGFETAVVNGE